MLTRLQALLDALVPDNRFYTAKLGPSAPRLASVDDFAARIPFTTKAELVADQLAHPPFGSNLTFPLSHYTRFSQTSATTGRPLRWLDTPASWQWLLDNWTRVFQSAGVTAADRVFCAFSFGPFLGFWTAFEAAERLGCLVIPGGGMTSAARLAVLVETGATVLCATPTYAIHLAEAAAKEGIDLAARSRVRRILVAGEPGGSLPSTRRRIESLWPGAMVVDHHGMTEIGPVTYGCPAEAGVLHVIAGAFHAEVVDPASGSAVAPGTRGELVLTNLGRLGSPLVRYRTGDVVVARPHPAARCACGTSDPALVGGILGRTDDMVVVRGVNVYPAAVDEIVRSCGVEGEYRVTVGERDSLAELALEIETREEALVSRLQSALRTALALRIPVKPVEPGSLPRFELKARRWVKQ